jgi:hypothetical protein
MIERTVGLQIDRCCSTPGYGCWASDLQNVACRSSKMLMKGN